MADNNEISISFSSIEQMVTTISNSGKELKESLEETNIECNVTLDVAKELIEIGNDLKEVMKLFAKLLEDDGKMLNEILQLKIESERRQAEDLRKYQGYMRNVSYKYM